MKLDKKIAKLLEEHDLASVMRQLIFQTGLTNVMVQVSNSLLFSNSGDKNELKKWTKRAKTVHSVIDEIEAERVNKNAHD